MMKNKLFVVVLILISVISLAIFFANLSKSTNHISGQIIAENLEFTSGYVEYRKYAVNGYATGESKVIELPYSEFLMIKRSIQEVLATSITVTNQHIEDLNYVSHIFNFQTKSPLIIVACYSRESNRLIFRYGEIFRNGEDRPIYDTRLIVLNMNDSFKEVAQSLHGKMIQ